MIGSMASQLASRSVRLLLGTSAHLAKSRSHLPSDLQLLSTITKQHDIDAANQELNTMFNTQHQGPLQEPAPSLMHAVQRDVQPEERAALPGLTHVDVAGHARMVDISHKSATARTATASCSVLLGPGVFSLVAENKMGKGDVLTTAQLAGIMAAKQTSALIPLCHPISLSNVHVACQLAPSAHSVVVRATVKTVGATGVEMEALTAAAVAALTVYDMCKAASKELVITELRLESKTGGKSGDFNACASA